MKRSLTEDERNTIVNRLRVAAERFKKHAEDLRAGIDHTDQKTPALQYNRLAEQFDRQAADSLKLAEAIENAEDIDILTAPDEQPTPKWDESACKGSMD